MPSVAVHGDSPDPILPEVLLDLGDDVYGLLPVANRPRDPQRVVNRREVSSGELDVQHGTDDLDDLSDSFCV